MPLPLDVRSTIADLGRFAPGVLLVASGVLKRYFPDYLSTELFSLANPWLYTFVYSFEIVVGLLLIFRVFSGLEAVAALLTFVGFTGLQVYYLVTGVESCRCFGAVSIPTKVMLGLDIGMVVLLSAHLAILRPKRSVRLVRLGAVALVLAALLSAEEYLVGGKDELLAWVQGKKVFAVPARVDFGSCDGGTVVERWVHIRNRTDDPVRIVGVSDFRLLTAADDLPKTIPPGETGSFRVKLICRGKPIARHSKTIEFFYLTNGQLKRIESYVLWLVKESREQEP